MYKPKLCPFCKSKVHITESFGTEVSCYSCGFTWYMGVAEAMAIEKWNERPIEDELRTKLEHIKRLIVERRDVVLQKINEREVGSLACEYRTLNMLLEAFNDKGGYEK